MSAETTNSPLRDALYEDEARERFALIEDVSYELALDLRPELPTYEGRAVVRFRCRQPGQSTFLDFSGKHVLGVTINGRALDPAGRTPYRLALPGAFLAERNEVIVLYRSDYDRTGIGLHRFQDPEDGEVYLYTDFEPFNAHRLFPCFDQPDLKATYDLTVSAPGSWTVVANGAEVAAEPAAPGHTRRRFARLPPFSTYLFAIIAGPYVSMHDTAGSVPLGLYCRRSLQPFLDPAEIFEITRQGFAFYSRTFGCPYAFGKYDQVFVPEYNSGAMENVAAVTFNEVQVFRDPPTETQRLHRAEVILHELAHMWFGNLVTMKWWDGLWLNESFATYISFLALSEATRFSACWQDFLGSIKTWAYREDQKPTTHPISGRVADTEQTFLNFDGITYGKGASVLKQVRCVLGGEAFDDGLRRYFRRHALGNTTIGDFLAALGEAAGRDLAPWSRRWLETSGLNVLRPEIRTDGRTVLLQEPGNGDGVLRPHTLDVALFRPGGDGTLGVHHQTRVVVDGAETPLPGFDPRRPGDILWCNQGDHAYAKVHLDPPSLAAVRERLGAVRDPLVRLGLWGTLWEMTRDALLAPAEYLGLVRRFLPREEEAGLAESVLRNATTTLGRFLAPALQPDEGGRLIAAAEDAVRFHPAGSDLQRLWGRALIGFVSDAAQAARLRPWLDGDAPGSVEVDQGMRWRIVSRASAFGVEGAAQLVGRETERDRSDRGVKAAYAARIAGGDPQVKREAFDSFCHPGTQSADHLKQGMAAFWWPHQAESLRPLAIEYFAALPRVLAAEDLEYVARGFVRVFFPHPVADPAVLAAAEQLLATIGEDQPLLRRFLLEETDELRRALRLRSLTPEPRSTPRS